MIIQFKQIYRICLVFICVFSVASVRAEIPSKEELLKKSYEYALCDERLLKEMEEDSLKNNEDNIVISAKLYLFSVSPVLFTNKVDIDDINTERKKANQLIKKSTSTEWLSEMCKKQIRLVKEYNFPFPKHIPIFIKRKKLLTKYFEGIK